MPAPRPVQQYLERYAAAEIRAAKQVGAVYDRVLAIPAKAENPSFLDGLAPALRAEERTAVIVVVNAKDADGAEVHRRNEALYRDLCERAGDLTPLTPSVRVGALAGPGRADLIIVDRFSPGRRFSPRQGVGLARGIACDVALSLYARGRLRSRWLHTTDADATLPADYFAAADAAPRDAAGLSYPFWHETSDTAPGEALALYEISLRYYVLGLAFADSPYAFHTLGSTMAADAVAYAACRGMPKREFSEDFYLLGKLSKLGPITRPVCSPIRLRQRLSDRVPVGTGPAARAILRDREANAPFRLYDPRVFEIVFAARRGARAFAESRDLAALRAAATPRLSTAYRQACAHLGLEEALSGAAAGTTSAGALERRLESWLDGFRTFKLIRGAQAAGLTPMSWRLALASAPFLSGRVDPRGALDDIRADLARAETE